MTALVATRTELLRTRAQAAFAGQGRDLIWDKRTALVRELRRIDADLLRALGEVRRLGTSARAALDAAIAEEGPRAVAAVALGSTPSIRARRRERRVAGVRIAELDVGPVRRDPADRGAAPVLVPATVTEAATAYEHYLEEVLAVCALELTVRRLAAEITRATRQVNALENVVVPELERRARTIREVLDEREREEHARLKRARAVATSPEATSPGTTRPSAENEENQG
ncbi:MAG: V-type ATP synthase subunit D [Dermatophilaceae bacterium]